MATLSNVTYVTASNVCDSKFGLYGKDNYCQACGAIMENNGDDDDE